MNTTEISAYTSGIVNSLASTGGYQAFLQSYLKPLDDFHGIDSFLRNFWTNSLETYGHTMSTIVIPFIVMNLVYFVPSLFMFFLEFGPFGSYLEKYKIQKKHNPATQNWKCIKQLIFNHLLVILPLYAAAFSSLTSVFGLTVEPETLPPWYVIIFQLSCFFVIEDFSHYWLHRLLHTEFLYRHIHSVHHEYTAPMSLSANYSHPLEIIILGACTFLGPMLMKPHVLVLYIWVDWRQLTALETHTGYEFPFSVNKWLPFCGSAEFHDFHHRTFNGAFASNFTVWDRVFGTDKGFYRMKDKKQKAVKNE